MYHCTHKLEEAGQQGEQTGWWALKAAGELVELHFVGALTIFADLFPEGSLGIMERPDSHGSPSSGLTFWPGHVWFLFSDRRHDNMCDS